MKIIPFKNKCNILFFFFYYSLILIFSIKNIKKNDNIIKILINIKKTKKKKK